MFVPNPTRKVAQKIWPMNFIFFLFVVNWTIHWTLISSENSCSVPRPKPPPPLPKLGIEVSPKIEPRLGGWQVPTSRKWPWQIRHKLLISGMCRANRLDNHTKVVNPSKCLYALPPPQLGREAQGVKFKPKFVEFYVSLGSQIKSCVYKFKWVSNSKSISNK